MPTLVVLAEINCSPWGNAIRRCNAFNILIEDVLIILMPLVFISNKVAPRFRWGLVCMRLAIFLDYCIQCHDMIATITLESTIKTLTWVFVNTAVIEMYGCTILNVHLADSVRRVWKSVREMHRCLWNDIRLRQHNALWGTEVWNVFLGFLPGSQVFSSFIVSRLIGGQLW